MARTTKKDITRSLEHLKKKVNWIAKHIPGTKPFGDELDITTWNPGDGWVRYQLNQYDKKHTGALRWEGRYYTIAEMDGALELCNKILSELIWPIRANEE